MKIKKWFKYTAFTMLSLAAVVFLAFKLSPWPSVLIVRSAFDKGGIEANRNLEKFVPKKIVSFTDVLYDSDTQVLLDLYHPKETKGNTALNYPLVVWIHGGGLVSGSKEQVANYCKIIAGYGYAVAAIDYTLAPEAKYPTPILQAQTSLKFLMQNAAKYSIDTSKIFLAGDSGGSMIAAATAAIIGDPSYGNLTKVNAAIKPKQLKGLLLFCGIYDIGNLNLDGAFGSFMRTVLWSYFGKKDISNDKYAQSASVINYVDRQFSPAFITAGNGDPLLKQSTELAKKMKSVGIKTETLFFPDDKKPALGHEYQFNMETEEGKMALKHSIDFLIANSK